MKLNGLKKRLLMILLMLVTTASVYTQQSNNLTKTREVEYKINLTKETYTRDEVQAIIEIYDEELTLSIDKSYNEGYKQGLLEAFPSAVYYMKLNEGLNEQLSTMRKENAMRNILYPIGFTLSFCLGASLMKGAIQQQLIE